MLSEDTDAHFKDFLHLLIHTFIHLLCSIGAEFWISPMASLGLSSSVSPYSWLNFLLSGQQFLHTPGCVCTSHCCSPMSTSGSLSQKLPLGSWREPGLTHSSCVTAQSSVLLSLTSSWALLCQGLCQTVRAQTGPMFGFTSSGHKERVTSLNLCLARSSDTLHTTMKTSLLPGVCGISLKLKKPSCSPCPKTDAFGPT